MTEAHITILQSVGRSMSTFSFTNGRQRVQATRLRHNSAYNFRKFKIEVGEKAA